MKIKEILKLINNQLDSSKMEIPEYQREYVWDGTSNVSKLLESFIKGYPVGSILLWKTIKDGESVQVLIDGLQRTFSINSIRNMPLKHMTWEVIESFAKLKDIQINLESEEDFTILCKKLNESILNTNQYEKLEKIISEERDEEKIKKLKNGKYKFTEYDKIETMLNNLINDHGLISFKKIIKDFEKWCEGNADDQFGGIDINVINMPSTLKESDIPEVFERINSNGKKLSNYEIYSSTWAKDKILLDETPEYIIDFVSKRKNRYRDSLNAKSIDIVEELSNEFNPSIVIYSILYEALKDNEFMKNIFTSNGIIKDINTMSYIIGYYLGVGKNSFSDIGFKLREKIDGKKENLEIIIKELKKYFQDVSDSLKMFNFLNNPSGSKKISFQKIKISEHLIVSFINTLIKINKESADESIIENTKKNFKYWFLIEGIDSSYGSGSGSTAWKFVNEKKYASNVDLDLFDNEEELDPDEIDAKKNVKFNEERQDIKNRLLEKALNYINEEKNRTSLKSFQKQAVLLLGVIQYDKENIASIQDHVDHVVPKSKFKNMNNTKDVHSLFNLQLLDSTTNLEKLNKISVDKLQWDWLLIKKIINQNDEKIYKKTLKEIHESPKKEQLTKIIEIRETYYINLLKDKIKNME